MNRPLQNRMTPEGEMIAIPARGLMFGNRGGRIHDNQKRLKGRPWKSKQWICCVLDFNNRQRNVWGDSYTELFFLDEASAFAAGHRPCFECRRKDAVRFATLWQAALGLSGRARAPVMDDVLHSERLGERRVEKASSLPFGTMFVDEGATCVALGTEKRVWSFEGYAKAEKIGDQLVEVLTPPSIRKVFEAGYRAALHPSALA